MDWPVLVRNTPGSELDADAAMQGRFRAAVDLGTAEVDVVLVAWRATRIAVHAGAGRGQAT